MKKLTLLSIITIVINLGLVKAQTNQGRILIGASSAVSLTGMPSGLGGISYSSIQQKSDKEGFQEPDTETWLSFNLMPKVGYFIIDNLVAGLDFNFALDSKEYSGTTRSQSAFAVGPFVRYYIPTPKVKPFFELNSSFGAIYDKTEYDNDFRDDSESENGLMSIGGGAGIAVPLGKRVMFDALAGYTSLTTEALENNEDNRRVVFNTYGIELGFTIMLGSE